MDADVNWMYIGRSEDVQDVLYMFNVRPVERGDIPKIWVALRKSFLLILKLINNVYMEVGVCGMMFLLFPFGVAAWIE